MTAAATTPSVSLLILERLRSALSKDTQLDMDALLQLMTLWATEFDRGKKLESPHDMNQMHVVGMALGVLFSRQLTLNNYKQHDLRSILGSFHDSVCLVDKDLTEYRFEEVQNILTAIQLEFQKMYVLDTQGFTTPVHMDLLCMIILSRAGHWFGHRWQADRTTNSASVDQVQDEALRGIVDVSVDSWASLRHENIVFFLDALHGVLGLHLLLSRAQFVACTGDLVQVTAHHLEASAETFFIHSMTADCMIGSVMQYAHRFAYLFHSISQAVYYNLPSYHRQRQLSLQNLQTPNTRHTNLLPLITELHPEIPVLFEHTGAGSRTEHALHRHAWVLWSRFVLLVDHNLNSYVAYDLRTLLDLFTPANN